MTRADYEQTIEAMLNVLAWLTNRYESGRFTRKQYADSVSGIIKNIEQIREKMDAPEEQKVG